MNLHMLISSVLLHKRPQDSMYFTLVHVNYWFYTTSPNVLYEYVNYSFFIHNNASTLKNQGFVFSRLGIKKGVVAQFIAYLPATLKKGSGRFSRFGALKCSNFLIDF